MTDPAAFDHAVAFVRILLTTSCLFGIFYVLGSALQGMGAATASFISRPCSFWRQPWG